MDARSGSATVPVLLLIVLLVGVVVSAALR